MSPTDAAIAPYKTGNLKESLRELWPNEGATPEEVAALEKKRQAFSAPEGRLAADTAARKKETEDHEKAAKEIVAAGIKVRDFAYSEGDEMHGGVKKET